MAFLQRVTFFLVITFTVFTTGFAVASGAKERIVTERQHVIYNSKTREISRIQVKIVDPHPDLALDFSWEPEAGNWPGVNTEGFAEGPGTVTWHIPGTPEYDPQSIHHSFIGSLKDGLFHGEGQLLFRDGSAKKGLWIAGFLEGEGTLIDAYGNSYEGNFKNGRAEGDGMFTTRDGWVYEGEFRAGFRDGDGIVTLPGGVSYRVVMKKDVEISSERPEVLPDPLLSGLLTAQSGGVAGNFSLSVAIDQRTTQAQEIQYTRSMSKGAVTIVPTSAEARQIAFGSSGSIPHGIGGFSEYGWSKSRAYVIFDLKSNSGARGKLKKFQLNVQESYPHLRPALSINSHWGCVGFRPSFNFTNSGWGKVENAKLSVRFAKPGSTKGKTSPVTLNLGSFDKGKDIDLKDVLSKHGVNVTALEKARPTCPSTGTLQSCRKKIIRDMKPALGKLATLVDSDWVALDTNLVGEIKYDWKDASGDQHRETEKFSVKVQLAFITLDDSGHAECGDIGEPPAQALQYTEIELPFKKKGYTINLPISGNPNVSRLTQLAKIYSKRSSVHEFQAEAIFSDGSVRSSAPVQMMFLNPRITNFRSTMQPRSCYISGC